MDDVGTYWLGDDGEVWYLVGYCEYPTVTWQRVNAPEIRRGGAAGSEITRGFVKLIREPPR